MTFPQQEQNILKNLFFLSLFLSITSCSLSFQSNRSIMKNMSVTEYNKYFKNKYWGSGRNYDQSDICVHFDSLNRVLVRTALANPFVQTGTSIFVPNSPNNTHGTLTVKDSGGVSVRLNMDTSSSTYYVEFQGQRLNLLSDKP